MSSCLEFRLLGPVDVLAMGRPVPIGGARQRTVLAMLALDAGRVVSVDRLAEAVWGGRPPSTGRTQVAICVSALRKAFRACGVTGDVIDTVAPGYVLRADGHRVDTVVFDRLVDQARAAAARGDSTDAVRCYESALALRRGTALANVAGVLPEEAAARLEEALLAAQEEQAELRLARGEHRALVAGLAAAAEEHPLRDRLHALLMTAQHRAGQRAAALETFARWRRRSVEDLGLEPSGELRRLQEQILRDDDGRAPARSGFAPIPAQLPAATQAFTGRAAPLAALDRIGAYGGGDGVPPLGLLVGGVGVGKTALAVWWGHRNADLFGDGQLFVDLHGHHPQRPPADPTRVLAQLLRALGVGVEPDACGTELSALFRTTIAGRRMLLILDDAADAEQVWPLLPNSTSCRVLVTSRDPLRGLMARCGRGAVRLGGLATDDAMTLLHGIVGDTRIVEDPEAAADLVELCGRLPGALVAAAASLASRPHWAVSRMVDELRRPAHRLVGLGSTGQLLRDGLATSVQALDPTAALLYRAMGGLPGSELTCSTAETLLDCAAVDAGDALERLVDAHLLEPAGADSEGWLRYRLPSLPHAYATELATARR